MYSGELRRKITGDLAIICHWSLITSSAVKLGVLLSSFNLEVVNDGPTHVHSNGSQNKLDLLFESDADRRLSTVSTLTVGFSDHRLINGRFHRRRPETVTSSFASRDHKNIDLMLFRSFLLTLPSWVSPAADSDVAACQLDTDLTSAMDKFAPLRMRRRRLGHTKCPWLTLECVAAKRERRRLERRFVRSRSDADRAAYRRVCRETSLPIQNQPTSAVNSKNRAVTLGNFGGQ